MLGWVTVPIRLGSVVRRASLGGGQTSPSVERVTLAAGSVGRAAYLDAITMLDQAEQAITQLGQHL